MGRYQKQLLDETRARNEMETQLLREKNTLEMQCAARVRDAETKAAVLQTRNDEMRRRLDDNDARIQEVRQRGEVEVLRLWSVLMGAADPYRAHQHEAAS